jgi:hypothetical protein
LAGLKGASMQALNKLPEKNAGIETYINQSLTKLKIFFTPSEGNCTWGVEDQLFCA